jgi:NTP pyrophosphatase (non-canonical NTP hydrolase)
MPKHMKNTDASTTIKSLSDQLYLFSRGRNWDKGYNPSFLTKSIIIEAAELLEHFQKYDGAAAIEKMKDAVAKEKVASEIVDVLYYLLMLAKTLDIDMTRATQDKLVELATRYPAVSKDARNG